MQRKVARRERGVAGIWVLLLVGLVAAGAWNFHRNWSADRETPRPYRAYAEPDLARLAEAQRQEAERLRERWDAARAQRFQAGDAQRFDERVSEFEAAQSLGRRVRGLGAALSEREAALAEIEREGRWRDEERRPVRLFLRRLLTLD